MLTTRCKLASRKWFFARPTSWASQVSSRTAVYSRTPRVSLAPANTPTSIRRARSTSCSAVSCGLRAAVDAPQKVAEGIRCRPVVTSGARLAQGPRHSGIHDCLDLPAHVTTMSAVMHAVASARVVAAIWPNGRVRLVASKMSPTCWMQPRSVLALSPLFCHGGCYCSQRTRGGRAG